MNKKELEIVRDTINSIKTNGDEIEPILSMYQQFRKLYYEQCHRLKDNKIVDWNPKYEHH